MAEYINFNKLNDKLDEQFEEELRMFYDEGNGDKTCGKLLDILINNKNKLRLTFYGTTISNNIIQFSNVPNIAFLTTNSLIKITAASGSNVYCEISNVGYSSNSITIKSF